MHKRWIFVLLATTLLIAWSVDAVNAKGRFGPRKKPVYYLALGTSLAAGVQADRKTCESIISRVSYPKFLEWKIRKKVRNARLVNLGCPGETSTSFIDGGLCYPVGDGQLDRAIAFLENHREDTVVVTLDIGANDVLPCYFDPEYIALGLDVCIPQQLGILTTNLLEILADLRSVAPDVPIIGMNYYNPLLANFFEDPTSLPQLIFLQGLLNSSLESVYGSFGYPVADVAGAFRSGDTNDDNGNMIPNNVETICAWTWMCSCQNIHANWIGYWKMADAFEDELPDSLTCRPPWWLHKFWR